MAICADARACSPSWLPSRAFLLTLPPPLPLELALALALALAAVLMPLWVAVGAVVVLGLALHPSHVVGVAGARVHAARPLRLCCPLPCRSRRL